MVQLNVEPLTSDERAIDVDASLQIFSVNGVAVAVGLGLTVTITMVVFPAHPFAEGVIVYVTVPATKPLLFKTSVIEEPLPFVSPETFAVAAAVQENDVPATADDNTIEV